MAAVYFVARQLRASINLWLRKQDVRIEDLWQQLVASSRLVGVGYEYLKMGNSIAPETTLMSSNVQPIPKRQVTPARIVLRVLIPG